jgi:hypothetical protein
VSEDASPILRRYRRVVDRTRIRDERAMTAAEREQAIAGLPADDPAREALAAQYQALDRFHQAALECVDAFDAAEGVPA